MEKQAQHNYLKSILSLFRYYKGLAEKAMAQLSEAELSYRPEPESNNMAIIVKHLRGNMLSRWTDFLSSDGEKPWRNRDSEFEGDLLTREEILGAWEEGWVCLFDALNSLQAEDLQRVVYIRNEAHTVLEAINRQFAHYNFHIGQMVFLAKMIRGEDWQSLSIPKGKSEEFNKEKFGR